MLKIIIVGLSAFALWKVYAAYGLIKTVSAVVISGVLFLITRRLKMASIERGEKKYRDARIAQLLKALPEKDGLAVLEKARATVKKKNLELLTKLYEQDLM